MKLAFNSFFYRTFALAIGLLPPSAAVDRMSA